MAVPENITLGRLHSVIKGAMGWEGGHDGMAWGYLRPGGF
ncbi:hypothetical protein [Pseudomonas sp. WHRI 8519]